MALEGDQLTIGIASEGLAPNLPHAQHIHGLEQALSECLTILNDQDGDNLVNTTEVGALLRADPHVVYY